MRHLLPVTMAEGFNPSCAEHTNIQRFTRISLLGMMVAFSMLFGATSAFAQNVNVNPGAGTYPTLKAAFDAINAGTHTGAITIDIVNNTSEGATADLAASGVGAASYTSILIQPSGGAWRTITGSIAGPLINLNGADNVTIDGLNTGGNSLTIANTSTGLGSAIQFIGDASSNTIQNDTIKGSSASAAGAVILFSTGTTTGNDGNNVNHCSITAAGTNLPVNGIMSTGTSTSIDNSGNIINLNNIYDYFSATSAAQGINITFSGGSSAWTITNNRLYQTANRITTSAGITHSGIFIGTGSGYTITGNIIGFANASGTGTTNMAGIASGALSGTFPSSYTLGTAVLANTRYVALNCAFTTAGTVSEIQNNTIGGFALLTSSGASTSNGIWCGINIVSGNANIGTTTGNTIGATTGSGSIYTACSTTGGTAVGIYATTTNSVSIQNNSIGAFDAVGTTATTTGGFTGIDGAGTAGVLSITNNNIGNASADNIRTGYTLLSGNLSNAGVLTSSTGATSAIVGARSSSTGTPLAITGNTLRGWATSGTVTTVTGISSTGAVASTVNLNSNLLGTASLDWIRYAVANSGTLTGINCTGATTATTISIQSNNIRGITYSVAGSGANTYINITGATATNVIATVASNLFTNLNVNTTGAIIFISHGYAIPSTGQLIFNNNSIVTAYSRGGATGSVILTSSNSTSGTGSINNYTNNNFSNITVTGTTTITGFNNTDGGAGSTKTITGNTFNNWTGGTGTINTMNFSYWNGVSSLSNNTITNITNQGTLTGVTIGSSTNNATSIAVANNTISNLSSTGTGGTVIGISCSNTSTVININNNTITALSSTGSSSTVSGVSIGGAATTNIFKNKIADLSGSQAGSIVNGINIISGTTLNISNNLIGNLTAPAATGLNAINGINASATSTYSVYYNTIYLNASSTSATTFGTSCMTFSSTATSFNSRNNILVNMSTPAQEGSNATANGIAAGLRRSSGTNGTVPANYSTSSNNNLYWVNPTLGTNNHLTYVEGTATVTNPFNTLALFKTFLINRDQASVTESVSTAPGVFFQNFTASNAAFLHLVAGITTQAESGAVNIASYTDDYDAEIRQGNGGYSGSGSAPDIGADEFSGVAADLTGPAISYTPFANSSCTTDITVSATITDLSGVNVLPMTKPRLYFKKTGDANTYAGNTSADNGWKYVEATNAVSPFTFTTNYALLQSAVVTTDVIQYFIVAQDLATPNVGINSGIFNAAPTSVALVAGNFPITGTINSYTIVAAGLSGAVTVGAAGTYSSLTGAAGLFNAINTSGMSSSVLVQLLDASIAETGAVALNAINYNGCASGPYSLVIRPASGVNTILTGSVSSGAIIKLNGADNVTFDGSNNGTSSRNLTITNTTTTTSGNAVIWLAAPAAANGANNNTIKNCIIEGNAATTSFLGVYVGGNASISLTSAGLENNNNTTIQNNLFRKTQYGLAFFGYAAATPDNGNMIINNNFGTAVAGEGFQLEGIHIDRQNNMVVSGNEVQNVKGTSTTPMYGIRLLDFKNGQAYKNNVHNLNYSGASTGRIYGIALQSSTYITAGNPSQAQIYNNLVYDVTSNANGSSWNMVGLFAGQGYGDKYYFNSVHLTGQLNNSSSGLCAAFANGDDVITGFGTNLDVRNNIFSLTGSSLGGNVWAYYSRAVNLSGTTQNNNVLRCAGTGATNNVGRLNSLNYATLALWQAASGVDANSLESDPLFNSSTNLIPFTGSPTLGAGANGTGITIDYLGFARSMPPTIGAYEQTGDFAVPVITYTPLTNTACTMSPALSATITDATGVNTTAGTKPRLYYKKSTDANTYAGNTNADNGWKYVEATNATSPFTFSMDYTLLQAAVAVGDIIQYFVVAQDLVMAPNVGVNTGTFAINPSTVALIAANFPISGMNSYTILNPGLTGTVTIGAAGTYTTLTGAAGLFLDINTRGLAGNLVVEIIDASITETGTNALNAIVSTACSGGPFTLTIKPGAGVTTVLSGSNATALIDLNGPDNVTFDGSNSGGSTKDMTIRNTGTGATLRLINDATSNLLKNIIIESPNSSSTSGTILFSSSTGTLGNSSNTITNCDIRDRSDVSGVPANAVYSSGSSLAPNGSNTISNCNIFNWTNSGVLLSAIGAGNAWAITGNNIYQTASRTTTLTAVSLNGGNTHTVNSNKLYQAAGTLSTTYTGISIAGSGNAHNVNGNSIGGAAPDRSGAALTVTGSSSNLTGIALAVGTSSATNVNSNLFSNVSLTTTSTSSSLFGINVTGGNVNIGTGGGNIFGGGAAAYDTLRNNYDNGIITCSGSGTVDIQNNTIGNLAYYRNGNDRTCAINITAGIVNIKNNIIRDIKANSSGTSFSFLPVGILVSTTTAGNNIEGNQIYNIRNSSTASGALTVAGVIVSGAVTTSTIQKNKIYNITADGVGTGSSSPRVFGMYSSAGSITFSNNMVSVGSTVGLETRVTGIELASTSANNFYFNSVSVSGTTSAGANNSYAFNRSATGTVVITDNIFSNSRTGGTGFHVAIANTNAAATGWAAGASNYNVLNNSNSTHLAQWLGTAASNNRDMAGWQAAQGAGTPGSEGDLNSLTVAPVFAGTNDLHLTPANGTIDNQGTPAGSITIDIDNDMRSVTTPDMGADEFMAAACSSATAGTAAITGPSTFCTSGTPVITASGYSIGIGSGYQWMYSTSISDYPTSGTAVMGQTNPATLSTGVVSTTTYYWLKVTCATGMTTDYSNMLTITITPPPTATLSPAGTTNICPPTSSQILTATTNASSPAYVWRKDGVIIGGETSNSYTVTVTGGYTVSITDGTTMCSNTSAASTVIFNVTPVQPVINPSSAVMCGNDPAVLLTASGSGGGSGTALLSSGTISQAIPDNISTGTNHTLTVSGVPAGAVIDSVIVTFNITHDFSGDVEVNLQAPNGQIINLEADRGSTSTLGFTNTRATSDVSYPSFSTGSNPFTGTFRADATAQASLIGAPAVTTQTFSNLFPTINGGWKISAYDDANLDFGTLVSWSIKIVYLQPAADYTWSPNGMGSGLFTDAGAMTPYTGTSSATVYAKPSSTANYTVTATNGGGCTNTQTVMVTVNPAPTITLGANPTVCSGITMANLTYSGTTESPDQYSINYNAGAEAQGFADVTNLSLPSSPIVLTVPGGAAPGTYNATLTVRNSTSGCVSSSSPITVTISPAPNAGAVSGMTPLCVGATDTYLASGDSGGTWTSSNLAKASVNAMSGLVTALAGGSTYIKYTVSNACGSPDADSILLTVDSIVVANNNDLGPASLRAIIDCAPSGSTITFAPGMTGQTIVLLTGEITISKNLTIIGLGANNLTLSGNNSTRVFHVLPGYTLTLQDIALKNATAATNGGAIFVEGNLNLNNVLLENNMESGVPKSLSVTSTAQVEIIGNVDFKQ